MRSQMKDEQNFLNFKAKGKLQQNLAHDPKHTYLFDEFNKEQIEEVFDKIKFFSDLELGISMEDMILHHKTLSRLFMPVTTFDDSSRKNQNDEAVSAIEGIVYPWFGVHYRIDRIQFGMEPQVKDKTDHSRQAVQHAQKIANLFVDEARLSGNAFNYVADEKDFLNLIRDNDAYHFEIPLIQSNPDDTIRTELYLF
jgi:hypothetical protein